MCKEIDEEMLERKMDKAGVISEYGSNTMPMMQRSMIGEDIYGTGVTLQSSGQQKEAMLGMQRQLEDENSGMKAAAHVDTSSML